MYIGVPFRPVTHQSVAYTGTAGAIANGVGTGINVIRVMMTTAGFIAIGRAPAAATTDVPMAANVPEYFLCEPGDKVSAIQASAGGNLHVTEMSR